MPASYEIGDSGEYTVSFVAEGQPRMLVLPAWFDEANKMRHFTIETMRLLHDIGWSLTLPDLPGCNESRIPLALQDLASWRNAARSAAARFEATYCLAIRAGAAVVPSDLQGWRYAPLAPKSALRALVRARILAAKEAGGEETTNSLMLEGASAGLELAGYRLGPAMIRDLGDADLSDAAGLHEIPQGEVGGGGLWLRAEPDFDREQAENLADIIGPPR